MKDIFSVEEINLMCIFDTSDKAELLSELRVYLDIVDGEAELLELFESTIAKLETVSDEDFKDIVFYIADDFDDGEE